MKSFRFAFLWFSVAAALVANMLPGNAGAAQFGSGWTLAGNGRNAVIDVPIVFGSKSAPVATVSDAILTIWKWDAIGQKWAFYTPTLDLDQVAAYASSKGYSVLKTIFPGEGYWVNASKPTSIADSTAPAFALGPWSLTSGWNLVATGSNVTAPQFSTAIAPFSATTLWAWDATAGNWYFHAPSLDSAALATYITQKNYLAFGNRSLDATTGFWINRAAVQGSPTANLAPLDQAKQMFSELRTTFHAFSNSAKTGSLDDQARRMHADLKDAALPSTYDILHRAMGLRMGVKLFRAVKRGQALGAYAYSSTAGTYFGANVYYVWQNDYELFPGFKLNSPNRVLGAGYMTCGTNSLSSQSSTAVSSVTCFVFGEKRPTVVSSTTTTEPYVRFTVTETGTDQYAYQAQGRVRTTVNGTGTTADTGASYSGTFGGTVDANGNVQAFTLAGDIPALSQGLAKIVTNLSMTRSLQTAGSPYATYRYAMSGSIAGVNDAGTTLFNVGMETGSYFDRLEDTLGNPKPRGSQELNFLGVVQNASTRFNGTLVAKAFAVDADGTGYIPTDVSFTGRITDISTGGSGAILNGSFTAAVSDYGSYRSSLPPSATNYRHDNASLSATITLPSRPTMALTLSDTATGPSSFNLTGQYTYDNGMVITITGTHDSGFSANRTLTFTNQDGIVVTRPGTGNGTITKGGTTLGQVTNGTIFYSDGVFESLN